MAMQRKGTGEYPPDWNEIAQRVKAEVGWRCVRCGHPDGDRATRTILPEGVEPGPTYNPVNLTFAQCDERCRHPRDGKLRMLTVHHLDMDKSNCAWWNLAALCQVCHLRIQAKVIMQRVWMLDHSEWFKPYVAGYYAAQFGRDTSRDYVLAHLDELIALGQGRLEGVHG